MRSEDAGFLFNSVESWLFLGFLVAFAIKVPIFPFHSWLPDAHVQAPTAGSVILAGVLLKMGTYGIVRFNLNLIPRSDGGLGAYHRLPRRSGDHLWRLGQLCARQR